MALRGKKDTDKSKNTNPADDIEAAIAAELAAKDEATNDAEDVSGEDKAQDAPDPTKEEAAKKTAPAKDAPTEDAAPAEDKSAPVTPKPRTTSKAVAVRKPGGAIVEAKGIFMENEALQAVAAEAEFGDLPKVVPTQGILKEQDSKTKLGTTVVFTPVLSKTRWCVTPGSNDDEAKEYFVVDYEDPKNLDGALQEAKAAGYTKAAIKRYLEVYGLVTECESYPDLEGELVQFQMAPSSVRQWKKFSNKLKVQFALNKLQGEVNIRAIAVADSWDGNDYTRFGFEIA